MELSGLARMSRRDLLYKAGASASALLTRRSLRATPDGIVPTLMHEAANATINLHPIRRNIYALEGSGGNIAVLAGKDGKLLVDAGLAVSRTAIAKSLQSISADPITRLINTHWHTDHTDGNSWLHSVGAKITAHENTKKHLSVATRVEGWQWTFPAAPAGALPAHVFASEDQIHHDNTRLALKHYENAHTDSDIWVHFTDADVVHLGDTWWNGFYPFIDYSTGGSIDGQIQAAEANLKTFSKTTLPIPGHGPMGTMSDVVEFREMLVTVRSKVAKLKQEGRSLADTIAAKPTSRFDAKWGNFLIKPPVFTELVYMGV